MEDLLSQTFDWDVVEWLIHCPPDDPSDGPNSLELSRLANPRLVSRRTQDPGWLGRLQQGVRRTAIS